MSTASSTSTDPGCMSDGSMTPRPGQSWQDVLADIRSRQPQFSCLGMGCLSWIIILLGIWIIWHFYG